jgi:UDP-N-acetylmuramoyl-L-alanyl-D-glutamate--2,6-diaminopimelate ligase
MKKKLSAFIGVVPHTITQNGDLDPLISEIVFDSRKGLEGALFIAFPGMHETGNKYIGDALKAGAVAFVYQGEIDDAVLAGYQAVGVRVADARFSMAAIAAVFYDNPATKLRVIGVTGTEGKSSTVAFIWQFLRLSGKKAGFISTVQYSLGGEALDNPEHQTTPESPIIQKQLASMVENGCEYAVLEASSHGLSKRTNRLGSILFDAAVMMNVTHEHLEFHGTWEQYRDDKANLFRALKPQGFGVVNADDASAPYFVEAAKPRKVYEFRPQNIYSGKAGIAFMAQGLVVRSPLPGAFNSQNVLAAMLVVHHLCDIPLETLVHDAAWLTPVTGRMTVIDCGQPFEVIVDYAHTPSSFAKIFPPLKVRAKGRIISVFGSGGERDTAKRPEQGKIAGRWSDIVILTDEDPRGEDPVELLKMIEAGCLEAGKVPGTDVFIIPDRPTAIRKAFALAEPEDIVLLLGKSHENSIIYKKTVMPYSEIAEARKALGEMGFSVEATPELPHPKDPAYYSQMQTRIDEIIAAMQDGQQGVTP